MTSLTGIAFETILLFVWCLSNTINNNYHQKGPMIFCFVQCLYVLSVNTLVIPCNTQLQSGSTRSNFGRNAESPIQCESHIGVCTSAQNIQSEAIVEFFKNEFLHQIRI